jgi:hypothetical protein
MLSLLVLIVALAPSGSAATRTYQRPVITQQDIAKLPLNVRRKPRIGLRRALKIADRYAKNKLVPLKSYYLAEAQLTQSGGDEQPKLIWAFRWVPTNNSSIYYLIEVSMDGKPALRRFSSVSLVAPM